MVGYGFSSNHRHERIEQRLQAVHDVVVAYAGTRERFTRSSQIPCMAKWQVYELIKDDMTPEEIGTALRFKYSTDFSQSGPSGLLSVLLKLAEEEFVNSGHVKEYIAQASPSKN